MLRKPPVSNHNNNKKSHNLENPRKVRSENSHKNEPSHQQYENTQKRSQLKESSVEGNFPEQSSRWQTQETTKKREIKQKSPNQTRSGEHHVPGNLDKCQVHTIDEVVNRLYSC